MKNNTNREDHKDYTKKNINKMKIIQKIGRYKRKLLK